jgi:hypothetical protein
MIALQSAREIVPSRSYHRVLACEILDECFVCLFLCLGLSFFGDLETLFKILDGGFFLLGLL